MNNILITVVLFIVLLTISFNTVDFFQNNTVFDLKDISAKGPQGPQGRTGSDAKFPRGVIVAFNGNNPPKGWAICNGSNGTPDLRGRFILASSSRRRVGSKGGTEKVKLSVNQLPSHNHSMSSSGYHNHVYQDIYWSEYIRWPAPGGASRVNTPGRLGSRRGQDSDNGGYQFARRTNNGGGHSHSIRNTGRNQPHENMPPFYTLTYIMKL